MAHQVPDFETKDVLGKTLQFNGVVGTTPATGTAVPSSSQGKISSVLIRNPSYNLITAKLYASFDGGITFLELSRGEFLGWSPKNNASGMPIEQIFLKGNQANVSFETLFDFEP